MSNIDSIIAELNLFKFTQLEEGRIVVYESDSSRFNFKSEDDLIKSLDRLREVHNKKRLKEELEREYANLIFSENSVWIRQRSGPDIAAKLPNFNISSPDREFLNQLNKLAEALKDGNSFFCSSCKKVKSYKSDFAGSVFTAFYCLECASPDNDKGMELLNLIKQTKLPGFYD